MKNRSAKVERFFCYLAKKSSFMKYTVAHIQNKFDSDEKALNPYFWEGTNLLGFALMELRDQLK